MKTITICDYKTGKRYKAVFKEVPKCGSECSKKIENDFWLNEIQGEYAPEEKLYRIKCSVCNKILAETKLEEVE